MFDESVATSWSARYGESFEGQCAIDRFLNHRSVRQFSGEPIDERVVSSLVAAAQSAATSSNLQLWSVVSVQDPERRNEVANLCSDQSQIRDADWFFAFVADHHRVYEAAIQSGASASSLDYTEFWVMACIDAALAAERMVCAAEALGIGTCYIGALRNDPDAIGKLLKLPERSIGLFGLCLGWPSEDCTAEIKPRIQQNSVWFKEQYGEPDTKEYDLRMSKFYESQNMKGDVTWSMRSGRRISGDLNGREVWKDILNRKGFGLR